MKEKRIPSQQDEGKISQPVKSFAELALEEKPKSKDIIATYYYYAESGAAINADVVIGIMKRTEFSRIELDTMLRCSLGGATAHHIIKEQTKWEGPEKEQSELREMDQYIKVADFALQLYDDHKLSLREYIGALFS